ncbi:MULTISPECIES: maleylacetoacetate isomerase [Hoeflea]|uniref:Maleylacetoacetate isomerase n=1 Tax=Hoeflea alexandrii TaxID=288436 RepID=A0ABT1CQM0_9HYPH|nr:MULTISPECIES: maleylacetoacetate isomerase [Hoeflea]MBV6651285.1 maleylacetoacetate isomerase [Hoeflea sp.]MCO6408218.1 maleylacetoacetate isomerase [Hoeflea alexandrii]MCY0153470.1 maleylacetoacetate isomerase [Hoeflea alexandrii]VVT13017.1 Maleylacetoacetate isomerase [Hoeflea sp. EC-HK425]|tara:strand:+ start:729 stop:1370 length:642 start_codon:yes stop_codon:yes gene_type:complete
MATPVLYDYWRSSASYRVRIALNLAGVEYTPVVVDLLSKAHKSPEHLKRNPQGLVPALEIDGLMLTQSLAIIEYVIETRGVSLLPDDAAGRARVRALADSIAMDIHPVCNMSVVAHLLELTGGGDAVRSAWMQKWIGAGLEAFEKMLDHPDTGTFCHGDAPGLADICLIPQIYNAERWGADISGLSRIQMIRQACDALPAFARAHPDRNNFKS